MSENSRHADIEQFPLIPNGAASNSATVLETSLSFNNGRYYLHATPWKVEGHHKSMILTHGQSIIIERVPRFNARRLAQLAVTVKSDPRYEALKAAVITKHQLQLVDDTATDRWPAIVTALDGPLKGNE